MFYLGKRCKVYGVTTVFGVQGMKDLASKLNVNEQPNYVLFFQEEKLDERVENFKKVYGDIELVDVEEPSFLDKTIHWINPKNKNEMCYVYRIK